MKKMSDAIKKLTEDFNKRMAKLKKEFMEKKSAEKFEYLYDKLIDLDDEKLDADEDWECNHYDCKCDENSNEIKEIKMELGYYIEKVDSLDDDFSFLNETVDRLEKLTGLDKIREKEKLEKERKQKERDRRYWAEKDPQKRMKILFGEE